MDLLNSPVMRDRPQAKDQSINKFLGANMYCWFVLLVGAPEQQPLPAVEKDLAVLGVRGGVLAQRHCGQGDGRGLAAVVVAYTCLVRHVGLQQQLRQRGGAALHM